MKRYPMIDAEKKTTIQSRIDALPKTTNYARRDSVRYKRALRTRLIEELQAQMDSIKVDTLENPEERGRRSNQHKDIMVSMLKAVTEYEDPKSNSKFNLNLKGEGSVKAGDESFLGKLLSFAGPLGIDTKPYTGPTLSATPPEDLSGQKPEVGSEQWYNELYGPKIVVPKVEEPVEKAQDPIYEIRGEPPIGEDALYESKVGLDIDYLVTHHEKTLIDFLDKSSIEGYPKMGNLEQKREFVERNIDKIQTISLEPTTVVASEKMRMGGPIDARPSVDDQPEVASAVERTQQGSVEPSVVKNGPDEEPEYQILQDMYGPSQKKPTESLYETMESMINRQEAERSEASAVKTGQVTATGQLRVLQEAHTDLGKTGDDTKASRSKDLSSGPGDSLA